MYELKDSFIKQICTDNAMHGKYLLKTASMLDDSENTAFESIINFFLKRGETIHSLASAYMVFVTDSVKEQMYFFQNGHYRYSSFKDVDDLLYNNSAYMHKYMLGVMLSHYLWISHIELSRYFKQFIQNNDFNFGSYLEIGLGYGEYFAIAMENNTISSFKGIDISETSVNGAKEFLSVYQNKNYSIKQIDFLKYDTDEKADVIVTTEVLEHVETPELFLKKIGNILSTNGRAYISTAINAPTIDHIYLFRSKEEVIDMVNSCGLKVIEYKCVTSNQKTLAEAEKSGEPVLIALIVSL